MGGRVAAHQPASRLDDRLAGARAPVVGGGRRGSVGRRVRHARYPTRTFSPLAVLAAALALCAIDPEGERFASTEIYFPFHDDVLLQPGEAFAGKLWRSPSLAYDGRAVPLVIMVHGITGDLQPYHWLRVDPLGPYDARDFVGELVRAGDVEPLVVATPSQTRGADVPENMFLGLDFDEFVDDVDRALAPFQRVDRARIVVVGHSASACYSRAASFASLDAKTFDPWALVAIEGCMSGGMGELLAETSGAKHVIVSYEPEDWERPIGEFYDGWRAGLDRAPLGAMRVLDKWSLPVMNSHLDIVEASMRKWLPLLLPASRACEPHPAIDLDL
jgi:hypothetical protein